MQFQGEAKFASITASGHCKWNTTVEGFGTSMLLDGAILGLPRGEHALAAGG